MSAPSRPDELPPGTRLSGYRIVGRLGRGGMGVVYRAVDERLGREVALKVVASEHAGDPTFARRFEREARAAASVVHPNVVAIHATGEAQGRLFMAFELVPGGNLSSRLKAGGRIPWREAASLGAQIARGLAAVHAAGVVHRDVKPENVLLDASGHAKLGDFGLVRTRAKGPETMSGGPLTAAGSVLGTLEYMPPEGVDNARELDARSDLYSLGATLHALVAGKPPFSGQGYALLAAHVQKAPPPLRTLVPDVPAALEALVLRLLAKDPAARPPTAGAVAEQLEGLARHDDGGAPVRSRALLGAALAGVLLLALAVLGAGASLLLRGGGGSPRVVTIDEPRDGLVTKAATVSLLARNAPRGERIAVTVAPAGAAPTTIEVETSNEGVVAVDALALPATDGPCSIRVGAASVFVTVDRTRPTLTPDPLGASADEVRIRSSEPLVSLVVNGRTRDLGAAGEVAPLVSLSETGTLRLEARDRAGNVASLEARFWPEGLVREGDGYRWSKHLVSLELVWVAPGEFIMGADDGQKWEAPRRTVTLDRGLWIGRLEVSRRDFLVYWSAEHRGEDPPMPVEEGNVPTQESAMEPLRWDEARGFCLWMGGRLPTEREWERAARGTEGRIYPWGATWDPARLNYCDRSCPGTLRVGSRTVDEWQARDTTFDDGSPFVAPPGRYPSGASPCGALDMAGNAMEWCEDVWDDRGAPEPENPAPADSRVRKGGCWVHAAWQMRGSYRQFGARDGRWPGNGVRIALSPP